ncbi:hypothetical protein ACFROC_07095, partial [Nocardia tengchongensis]
VYWDAGTARLLPRLIRGRTHGPVFVTHRRPGPGKYRADRDICPDTGLARLSYDQARDLLDDATATDGPGTGWDLHELRHSGLTHLGESGASLLELMAKSRHRKAENLRRYFKTIPAGDARTDQPHRPRHLPHPLTSDYTISARNSADTTATLGRGTGRRPGQIIAPGTDTHHHRWSRQLRCFSRDCYRNPRKGQWIVQLAACPPDLPRSVVGEGIPVF